MNKDRLISRLTDKGFSFLRSHHYADALAVGRRLKRLRHSSAFEIMALAHLGLHRLSKAIAVLEEGVAKAGRVWLLWELLGNCYSDAGRYKNAERAYQQRIEDEAASLAALEADHDDFRAALRWARSRPRDLLRLASALGWFWHLRSHYREGGAWLEQALAANPTGRSHEKARALWALSMILQWQGKIDAARPLAEEGLELWRETDDRLELALALESVPRRVLRQHG